MSLKPLQLDDLRWREMVDAIRGRIAAASGEAWTLHAPVDPGVTLLELLAHLLEQRVYWLDQVPDPLIHAMIALLGTRPRPARAATTLLELLPATAPAVVPAAVVFHRREAGSSLRFTSRESVAVLAVDRMEIESPLGRREIRRETPQQTNRQAWRQQALTLAAAAAGPVENRITLWMPALTPGQLSGESVALMLELESAAPGHARHSSDIPPGWSTEAVAEVSPPADLSWHYSRGAAGQRGSFSLDQVQDGTQGLRRSGVLRLPLPDDWQPAGDTVDGLQPYHLWWRTESATFSSPPRLIRLIPNVVQAAHEAPVTVAWDELAATLENWLPLPGQQIELKDDAPPLESSVRLRLRDRHGDWQDWSDTRDFARHGPEDRVFIVNRLFNRLEFGDGLSAALPVLPAAAGPKAELSYLAGGGEAGNLGRGLSWTAPAVQDLLAVNPVAARGGRESETASAAASRTTAGLQQRQRAVTAADYETLALNTPGVAVARARAAVGLHPQFPCVPTAGAISIFIVPAVPRGADWQSSERRVDAPQPDPGMLTEVTRRLDQRRLLTAEVFVRVPVYRPVQVQASLSTVSAGHGPADFRAPMEHRLRAVLRDYLDPLIGGPAGSGWPFGDPLRPSELTHVLQDAAGEGFSVDRVAVRLRDDADFEDCTDIDIAPHELLRLNSLAIQWQTGAPSSSASARGGLR